MSGIGSFVYQNWDFKVRNPIYRDLCDYQWPVVYDLSKQSDAVQAVAGSETVAFSYYLTYWLPPALVSKILGLNEQGRNLILYFYSLLGIFLVVYNLCRYFKKTSYLILAVFIFFSGMDVIGFLCRHAYSVMNQIQWGGDFNHFSEIIFRHMEWWSSI